MAAHPAMSVLRVVCVEKALEPKQELAYRHTLVFILLIFSQRPDSRLSAVGSPNAIGAAQTTHISQLSTVGSPNAIDAAMHHA